MAKLLSTGIYGFISSAKQTVDGWVSTFVSGVSGWIIKHNGDAEFKSIYARDKIVTNEYVYNRIRVTEDEEVITSNGKILSAVDNGDGTYTVTLDLREGDVNPFTDGDLLQGYYHNPENSGVIYAVQKMTVQADPDSTNQTMVVTCEQGSTPYSYMIIVRVGNLTDTERQSFIKISSRTNCQYFFDGISSFAALDNPDNVKCVLGKADMGLIPAWAASAIGNVAKWFGLIADGVILRGTLVLKSTGTTVEDEFDTVAERIVDVETSFEIREGQISSKVTEAEVYAKNAKDSAETATQKASETVQTAEGFQTTVSEITQQAVSEAVAGANEAIEEKVSTQVTQSTKQWKVEVMGADADGNPNTVLAAINADESGVKISGEKIQIDGRLIAQAILASGLNVNDNFIVNKSGDIIAKGDSEFWGKLKGVLGSFKSLDCVDGDGNVVGQITFGTDGSMNFNGDINLNVWGSKKGNFSCKRITCSTLVNGSKATFLIEGTSGYYYPDGIGNSSTRESLTLDSGTSTNGDTFYYIPLAGYPAGLILLKTTTAYRYVFTGSSGQEIIVANINDNQSNYIYSQGIAVEFGGGEMATCLNVGNLFTPTLDSTVVGRGWLIGAFRDNNWH